MSWNRKQKEMKRKKDKMMRRAKKENRVVTKGR